MSVFAVQNGLYELDVVFVKGFPVDITTVGHLLPVSCHVDRHFDGEVVT